MLEMAQVFNRAILCFELLQSCKNRKAFLMPIQMSYDFSKSTSINYMVHVLYWFWHSEDVIIYIKSFEKSVYTLHIFVYVCNMKFLGHIFIIFVYVCMYMCINRYSKKYHLIYVIALSTTLCKRAYSIYLVCRWVLLPMWLELFFITFITKNRSADIGLLNFLWKPYTISFKDKNLYK